MEEKLNNLFSFRVLENVENPSESTYIINQLNRWKSQKILSKKISAIITDYILNRETLNVTGATLGEKLQIIEKIFKNTSDDEKKLLVNMVLTITGSTTTFSPTEPPKKNLLVSSFSENENLFRSQEQKEIETKFNQDGLKNKSLNKTKIKVENTKKTANNFNDFDNLYDPYS